MKTDLKKVLLGILGEKIVAKYLRDCGNLVNESLNIFDSEKDMDVNGERVEVKTQVPLLYMDAFTISYNQLNKIKGAHRVYWVSVPPTKYDDVLGGCVFEMDPLIAESFMVKMRDGREMIGFKRNQKGMKMVYQIKDQKLLSHLKELNSSYM